MNKLFDFLLLILFLTKKVTDGNKKIFFFLFSSLKINFMHFSLSFYRIIDLH
jgi:hypothetical protein